MSTEPTAACQHGRYSIDTETQRGRCVLCGADGRMEFVVPSSRAGDGLSDAMRDALEEIAEGQDVWTAEGMANIARKALAAAPAAAPAEHLPTKEHIRELAQEALDQIMEQAQVFASAWSLLVGGKFDDGNALSDAEDAKAELRTMVRSLADLAAETVRPAASPAALTRKQIDDIMTQHYPLESLLRESVDAFEACVRDIEKALGIQAPATADGRQP